MDDVPVVERLHAQQRGLSHELPQHLVGRPHHPAGLAVAQIALQLQRLLLVTGAAAAVQHLVHHMGHVLGRDELDLPQPVQVVPARQVAHGGVGLGAVGDLVHRMGDREHEAARGLGVHDRLAHRVLDGRVVAHAHAHVLVLLDGGMADGDVDRAQRDAVPHAGRPAQEVGVDRLVVGVGTVADVADQLILRHELPVQKQRARLVAAQAHGVPLLRLCLDLVLVHDEHRQVRVVAVVVRRGGLQHVEVGETGRGRPRRLLQHLVAAVDPAGAGGDRIPEVRAGLGVGVGQGADQALADLLQIFLDHVLGGAQLERLHGTDMHHVTHRAGGVAVAGDRLGHVGVHDVVLPEAAPLLGQHQAEETVRPQRLEALAREGERAIVLGRQRPDRLLADLLQPLEQALLLIGEKPVGLEHRVEPGHGRLRSDRCHSGLLSLVLPAQGKKFPRISYASAAIQAMSASPTLPRRWTQPRTRRRAVPPASTACAERPPAVPPRPERPVGSPGAG